MSSDTTSLDNPIWNALFTVHAHFAESNNLARRYPADIGPLSGIKEQSPEAYASLAELLGGEEIAVLFLATPPLPPPDWRLVQVILMEQMVCDAPPSISEHASLIESLGPKDVPEMVGLAKLTEPGPFREGTIRLGGYRGIRQSGHLAAMSGQRLSLTGFTEVSAVCTHPDFRGRGYANALVSAVAHGIYHRGETPFLGVKQDNVGAIRVYQKLGFRVRATQYVTVVKRPL